MNKTILALVITLTTLSASAQNFHCSNGSQVPQLLLLNGLVDFSQSGDSVKIVLGKERRTVGTTPLFNNLIKHLGLDSSLNKKPYVLEIKGAPSSSFTQISDDPFLIYVLSKPETITLQVLGDSFSKTIPVEQVLVHTKNVQEEMAYAGKKHKSRARVFRAVIDVTGADGFTKRFEDEIRLDQFEMSACKTTN